MCLPLSCLSTAIPFHKLGSISANPLQELLVCFSVVGLLSVCRVQQLLWDLDLLGLLGSQFMIRQPIGLAHEEVVDGAGSGQKQRVSENTHAHLFVAPWKTTMT